MVGTSGAFTRGQRVLSHYSPYVLESFFFFFAVQLMEISDVALKDLMMLCSFETASG